jgi:hypothetical protein
MTGIAQSLKTGPDVQVQFDGLAAPYHAAPQPLGPPDRCSRRRRGDQ